MEFEGDVLVSPGMEVPVIEGEVVLAIRALADCGVGSKVIARAVGVARNTVRRYLRQAIEVEGQVRPTARRLTDDRRLEPRTLYAVRKKAASLRSKKPTPRAGRCVHSRSEGR